MLQLETLPELDVQISGRQYGEPEGELIEYIGSGSNSISVLTRIDTDKGERFESSPIDPSSHTVSQLEEALDDPNYDWNEASLKGLLEAEKNQKNRATAISAIEKEL